MTGNTLTDTDRELLSQAERVLLEHYHPDRHTTGAALRTRSDAIYTAVSVKGQTAKSDLHAEPIALANAIRDGETPDTVVAVQPADRVDDPADGITIVSACGVCRELMIAHAPNLEVVLSQDGVAEKRLISTLLPV